jgi:hypothetical protein
VTPVLTANAMTPLLNMLMGTKSFNGSYFTFWTRGAIAI